MADSSAQTRSPPIRVGVVITTFGAAAYVELQLALLGRYPSLRALVVDDASDRVSRLEALARRYNADLFVNDTRLGHLAGDLAGFATGLQWAVDRGLTHLVKFSRRLIPYGDWVGPFEALLDDQPTTVGAWCTAHNFFRTEAFAVDVAAWTPALKHLRKTDWLKRGGGDVIERYVHVLAHAIAADHGQTAAFKRWPLLGDVRSKAQPGVLWHDANRTEHYVTAARVMGLPLTFEDFEDFVGEYRNAGTTRYDARRFAA